MSRLSCAAMARWVQFSLSQGSEVTKLPLLDGPLTAPLGITPTHVTLRGPGGGRG